MKRVLIDGNNYINASPRLAEREDFQTARFELVTLAVQYASLNGCRVIVVFDGSGDVKSYGLEGDCLVEVIYSAREEADTVIERIVYGASDRREYCVVTDDRRLSGFISGLGASSVRVRSFEEETDDLSESMRRFDRLKYSDDDYFGLRLDI